MAVTDLTPLSEVLPQNVTQLIDQQNKITPLKPQEMPKIQPNSPQRLNPLPNTSDTQNGEIFDLTATLQKLNISDIMADFYKNCTSEAEVIEKRDKREEFLRQCEEEEKARKFREEKKRRQDLIKSAKIPKIFTDSRAKNFKITNRNENAATIAIKAITNNSGLFIYGECGTGKTMLASIIANERAELFKSSMFIGAVDIFQELNPYSSDGRTAAIRKSVIKNTPCLIIDDLGAEKPSEWTKQILFEIIDYRYREGLQTIITSNFNVDELLSNGRLTDYEGKRIIRRIKEICSLIELRHF